MADTAFVDRADIIQYVDLPPREAIYEILRGCLVELIKRGIVAHMVGLERRLRNSLLTNTPRTFPALRKRKSMRAQRISPISA